MCSLHVSRVSKIIPRYLTNVEQCKVVPKRRGSKNPGSFFLLVNETSPFLSGLTDRPSSSRHVSTVWRAHCMSPDGPWKMKKQLIRRQTQPILYGIHSTTVSFSICCLVFMRQLDYMDKRKCYIFTTCISRAMGCFVSFFREEEFYDGSSCGIRKSSRAVGRQCYGTLIYIVLPFSIPVTPVAAEVGKRRIQRALRRYPIILANNTTFC